MWYEDVCFMLNFLNSRVFESQLQKKKLSLAFIFFWNLLGDARLMTRCNVPSRVLGHREYNSTVNSFSYEATLQCINKDYWEELHKSTYANYECNTSLGFDHGYRPRCVTFHRRIILFLNAHLSLRRCGMQSNWKLLNVFNCQGNVHKLSARSEKILGGKAEAIIRWVIGNDMAGNAGQKRLPKMIVFQNLHIHPVTNDLNSSNVNLCRNSNESSTKLILNILQNVVKSCTYLWSALS